MLETLRFGEVAAGRLGEAAAGRLGEVPALRLFDLPLRAAVVAATAAFLG